MKFEDICPYIVTMFVIILLAFSVTKIVNGIIEVERIRASVTK